MKKNKDKRGGDSNTNTTTTKIKGNKFSWVPPLPVQNLAKIDSSDMFMLVVRAQVGINFQEGILQYSSRILYNSVIPHLGI